MLSSVYSQKSINLTRLIHFTGNSTHLSQSSSMTTVPFGNYVKVKSCPFHFFFVFYDNRRNFPINNELKRRQNKNHYRKVKCSKRREKKMSNFLPKIEQSFSFRSCNKSLEKHFSLCIPRFRGFSFILNYSQIQQRNVLCRFYFDFHLFNIIPVVRKRKKKQ